MKLRDIGDGNTDLSLVYIGHLDHPHCKKHGAMLRVSEDIKMYRCIRSEPNKAKYTPEERKAFDCRAGCIIEDDE